MTDWEKQLGRRAATVDRAKEALDADIAAARLDGASFRDIGRWASVNHERARSIAIRINGDSRTRDERAAASGIVHTEHGDLTWGPGNPPIEEGPTYRKPERPASSEEKTT
ncbi:hypothetical protein [Streptomyces sp. NPDC008240]|uniref:hypothetical protein n=1 Tax=Streptomyces sp. NPDC008240 TaxID=3364822 RepID=UPI0036F10AA2